MTRHAVIGVSMLLVAVTLTAQSPPRNDEVRFEVASVKPSSMPPQADRIWQVTPTRFTARNVPLRDYLVWAFDTDWRRLVTPSSFQNQRFDIAATGTTLNGRRSEPHSVSGWRNGLPGVSALMHSCGLRSHCAIDGARMT